jgi:hypothetical protein
MKTILARDEPGAAGVNDNVESIYDAERRV